MMLFSNEVLKFSDESGALAGRFLAFQMRQQFLGARQDPNLTAKLLGERAGILNLALDALDRLRARGHLIQCASGAELVERLAAQTSHIKRFVEDRCVLGAECEEKLQTLYFNWRDWCVQGGVRFTWNDSQFSEKLFSAVHNLTRGRPRAFEGKPDTGRATIVSGIRLRKWKEGREV
jgi:putative DNA primase/helicase